MNFVLKIKNFGNIDEAKVNIKPFTIIAGENGTGKSFVTKGLYCLLDCLRKNHASEAVNVLYHEIKFEIFQFHSAINSINNPASIDLEFIYYAENDLTSFLSGLCLELGETLLSAQDSLAVKYIDRIDSYGDKISQYIDNRSNVKRLKKPIEHMIVVLEKIEQIKSTIRDIKKVVADGINAEIPESFKKNFQISNLQGLIKKKAGSGSVEFDIDNIGVMKIDEKGGINFSFKQKGIDETRGLENIIFLDSPIYLKIKKGLERNSRNRNFMVRKDLYLSGYPEYIDKIYGYLDKEFIGTPFFEKLAEELKSLIDGSFKIASSGDIQYQTESGGSFPLSLVATGVSNIGLLEFLLRNNTITKGSFLFIDEPEAHLHPKWQVKLVNVLYEIAKGGANIVIATHSIDVIKAAEILLKKDKAASGLISLNRMPYSKEDQEKQEIEKVSEILSDLSAPFYELYLEGMS